MTAATPLKNLRRPGSWDDSSETVRLVRRENDSSFLIAIRNAHPWVLRRSYLLPEDVD